MTRILYFSGTGNSRLLAERLGEKLGAAPEAIPDFKQKSLDAQTLVLVFPVYLYDIPPVVKEFLTRTDLSTSSDVFALVSCGGAIGNLLSHLDQLLKTRGSSLRWGTAVPMVDNSIIIQTSDREKTERKAALESIVDCAVSHILSKNKIEFTPRPSYAAMEILLKAGMRGWYRFEHRKVDEKACSGCGLCAKSCPVKNVSMDKNHAVLGDACAWCFACINACPQKAISFGKIKPDTRHLQFKGF